jgi:hypothetical protein
VGKLHLPVVKPWVIAKKAMGRAHFSCSESLSQKVDLQIDHHYLKEMTTTIGKTKWNCS